MLFERLQDQTDETFTTVQVGSLLNEEVRAKVGNPLLFYGYQTKRAVHQLILYLEQLDQLLMAALCANATSNSTLTNYWIPSMNNELGTSSTAPTYNLNFGSEINTYNLTDYGGNNNSLFQKFYENYITRLFNKKTRLYKF